MSKLRSVFESLDVVGVEVCGALFFDDGSRELVIRGAEIREVVSDEDVEFVLRVLDEVGSFIDLARNGVAVDGIRFVDTADGVVLEVRRFGPMLRFKRYFKYRFWFDVVLGSRVVGVLVIGGDVDEIYRLEVRDVMWLGEFLDLDDVSKFLAGEDVEFSLGIVQWGEVP